MRADALIPPDMMNAIAPDGAPPRRINDLKLQKIIPCLCPDNQTSSIMLTFHKAKENPSKWGVKGDAPLGIPPPFGEDWKKGPQLNIYFRFFLFP